MKGHFEKMETDFCFDIHFGVMLLSVDAFVLSVFLVGAWPVLTSFSKMKQDINKVFNIDVSWCDHPAIDMSAAHP